MLIHYQSTFEKWPVEDKTVQCIATSPPYYALRRYDIPNVIIGGEKNCQHVWVDNTYKLRSSDMPPKINRWSDDAYENLRRDKPIQNSICEVCGAFYGQYGLEPDFRLYLKHTMLWLEDAWRVLKDDGCLFLNIADSYNSHPAKSKNVGGFTGKQMRISKEYRDSVVIGKATMSGLPDKSKLLIPERLAVMMSDKGWIIRNVIIWAKPNGLPESVKDRFSKSYEHIIFATKQSNYQFFLDNVRVPFAQSSFVRAKSASNTGGKSDYYFPPAQQKKWHNKLLSEELKGKNPSDVWTIPTQSSSVKHYAMFPEKLAERMILCSTKQGDIVLDPFSGSGTTLKVAEKLNRVGVGIELGYKDIHTQKLKNIQKNLL